MLRWVDQYFFAPGCCGLCRSSNLPTIDTGIYFNHPNDPNSDNPSADDMFYVCADCAIEMARMVLESRDLELTKAGIVARLEEQIQGISGTNQELLERIKELEDALRVINTIKPVASESPSKKAFKAVRPDEVEV